MEATPERNNPEKKTTPAPNQTLFPLERIGVAVVFLFDFKMFSVFP
jgi:hypothetical protein